jgi:hypothetical protein
MILCSKCGDEPRLAGQRWGRRCLTAYKRERQARLRAGAPRRWEPVTPEPLEPVEQPRGLCFRCGYHQWHERAPGEWVCGLCAIPPVRPD